MPQHSTAVLREKLSWRWAHWSPSRSFLIPAKLYPQNEVALLAPIYLPLAICDPRGLHRIISHCITLIIIFIFPFLQYSETDMFLTWHSCGTSEGCRAGTPYLAGVQPSLHPALWNGFLHKEQHLPEVSSIPLCPSLLSLRYVPSICKSKQDFYKCQQHKLELVLGSNLGFFCPWQGISNSSTASPSRAPPEGWSLPGAREHRVPACPILLKTSIYLLVPGAQSVQSGMTHML